MSFKTWVVDGLSPCGEELRDLLGASHAIGPVGETQGGYTVLGQPFCVPEIDAGQEVALLAH